MTEYQTVTFWKWIQDYWPTTLLSVIQTQQARTHFQILPGCMVENSEQHSYTTAFMITYPDVNFTDYVTNALYWKTFETDETQPGELWDVLGPPKRVPALTGDFTTLRAGEPGDSAENPAHIGFTLAQSLTAGTKIIQSPDISGPLHISLSWMPSGLTVN